MNDENRKRRKEILIELKSIDDNTGFTPDYDRYWKLLKELEKLIGKDNN